MVPRNSHHGVIFDLDGTLLNTLEDLADSMNTVLTRGNLPAHPVSAYRRFVGDGVTMLVTRALPEELREESHIARFVRDMRAEYARRWADKTKPYAGVSELIRELEARDIPMTILTNKPEDAALAMVAHFFPSTNFRTVMGAKPERPRKPDPTAALEIAAHLELATDRILFLGDSDADMLTARSAKMTALGAGWGFRGREELLRCGAQKVLESPLEMLDWLGAQP
ncbi:phosphoglycolate phosphatase [Desulfonatronum thiosulfatophilum]|uniref:phosphoglycolate phosphatase n=1 Tax=Desulfonatronum thiosulfatophilum TaxID=617002 RepID=A0A1G6A141_9BACT|nr:HAD family hydrolase [Desulfonatronum thiosulfatophilum]SDB02164.1 phosphoglycolate phosphatase [Desulfonatronum thiosulfatophilum]